MMDETKYYGVHILKDYAQNSNEEIHVYSNYEDAHRVVKENKNARFKCFLSEKEALYFAKYGSTSGPGNPNVSCESVSYKSLKRQEIYEFRKCIESNDLNSVKKLAMENPRYLIGIGDTPTIMQEGARYNALHIAAKHNRSEIADFILKTVGNKSFCQQLYGAAGDNSYLVRPEVMVDLYLNTPDKALNETPLHFAAKYGCYEVIMVFVQYPQLQLLVKNKYGQTPKDITCKLVNTSNAHVSPSDIHKLLDELYFVPVWRADDDAVQPMIGKPFSPKSPPVCPLAKSPLSPNMEIKAVAGPMSYTEASTFLKTWKSPAKKITCNTPHVNKGILLRSPLNSAKGLEQRGRSLAKQFHVSWKEYWPFLDRFIDLCSEEGLLLLNDYLKHKTFPSESSKSSKIISFASPVSELCTAFARFSINSPMISSVSNRNVEVIKHEATAPYLFIEKLSVVFAKNIVDIFVENFSCEMSVEDNVASLIKKMRGLSAPISACRNDKNFGNFPFNKVHSRIAVWITRNLSQIKDRCLRYATDTFRMVQSMNAAEIVHCISVSPSLANVELGDIIRVLKCVNDQIVKLSEDEILFEEVPETEEKCKEEWFHMNSCQCFQETANNNKDSISEGGFLSKFQKFKTNVSRKIDFSLDENDNDDIENSASEVTNTCINYDNASCDIENEESEDEFLSVPNSPCDSEDEWESADEGPEIFILDNKGTSIDNAVLEAISDVRIDPEKYPFIYRWKHYISLHNVQRLNWPSPTATPYRQMKLMKNTIY